MDIINLQQFIWQAVNFFILYLVIAKFVIPPTKKYLADREKEIAEGLANAEKLKTELAAAQATKEQILHEAREEGKRIIEEMKTRSELFSQKIIEEARAQAQEEVARLISNAEKDIAEKQAHINEEIISLAHVVAQKALSELVTADIQRSILEKQLHFLQTNSRSRVA
jgi:F-type H+-transporting ATPase subunit b